MLFGRKKRRIEQLLLVEDEPLIAFDTEHFLRDAGFHIVATVDTILDAGRVIEGEDGLDLVLADINLADGSGIDVARTAAARGVPVLFVTGNFPDEARHLAAGCLAKPYQQRDLLAAIAAIEAALDGTTLPRRLPSSFTLFIGV
jgi:DNA-binding response OmpR family regulator